MTKMTSRSKIVAAIRAAKDYLEVLQIVTATGHKIGHYEAEAIYKAR